MCKCIYYLKSLRYIRRVGNRTINESAGRFNVTTHPECNDGSHAYLGDWMLQSLRQLFFGIGMRLCPQHKVRAALQTLSAATFRLPKAHRTEECHEYNVPCL